MSLTGDAGVGQPLVPQDSATRIRQKIENAPYFREPLVEEIMMNLTGRHGRGVMLVGEYGTGKTFLLAKVAEQLNESACVVGIRGSSMASRMPYGAFSSLLNELDENVLTSPLTVLRGITTLLRSRANGRSIILCVDNAQDLDELAALIVGQLTANGTVRLLVACEDLLGAPEAILGLWKDGLVRRVEVGSFTKQESGQWLLDALGGNVSRAVADAVWEINGGNPRFTEVFLPEQIAASAVVHRNGIWVLSGESFKYDGTITDAVMTSLSGFSGEERQVLDFLALSGGMTLDLLLDLNDPVAVNTLEKRGYFKISRGEPSWVRLASLLVAQAVSGQATIGRSRELYRRAADAVADSGGTDTEEVSMALWSVGCGLALAPETVVRAAGLANTSGNPEAALKLVAALHHPDRGPESLAEEGRALIALGRTQAAHSLLFGGDFLPDHMPVSQWVDVQLMRCRLVKSHENPPVDSWTILNEVASKLNQCRESGSLDSHELTALEEELTLAQAELRIHAGRYLEYAGELAALYGAGSTLDRKQRAGLLLSEVLTLTGRLTDGLRLLQEIDWGGHGTVVPPCNEVTDSAILLLSVTQAAAAGGAASSPGISLGTFAGARASGLAELGEGLLSAYRGRTRQALERLVPAAIQLSQLDADPAAALANAAAAYAYALQGDNDLALQYLNKGRPENPVTSRTLSSACSYFQVLTSAELASKEKAVVRLFSLADQERRVPAPSAELFFVSAAVRLGSTSGAKRLIDVASSVQGRFARHCEDFGTALLASDATEMTAVAEAASRHDDDLFARDAARLAMKLASDSADRKLMRVSQQLIRESLEKMGGVGRSKEDGESLTAREQEVAAWAAAGVSNRAIAAKMHISVRTVEGHLYQIYGKLQVTCRAELKGITSGNRA